MKSLFGIETEYGITVEGADASQLVAEAREVVKSYSRKYAAPWNYRAEDSRNDVRGFRADHLTQDAVDAQFDRPGTRALSQTEDRCDRVLENGARLYNDHGHPEYATPECDNLRDLVAHDKAGERIVLECAKIREQKIGRRVEIWKNNSDFHGASYGTHESYLLRRDVAWDKIVENLAPFLATRILYAGAGKVGCEEKGASANYQLSQRADFFNVLQSVDTLANRPLVNTRDEAHGDAHRFRRLHIIAGDANMSEYATALRVGVTNLVVALIESGWTNPLPLRDNVRAVKQISRDESFKWIVDGESGTVSAIDVQRAFLDGCRKLNLPHSDWVTEEWNRVLDALESDPFELADSLDWVAKKSLLDQFVESENLNWKDDVSTLQSLDLAYHNVDESVSLYGGLIEADAMRTVVTEDEIERARLVAPLSTRASLRGLIVRRFADKITSVSWGAMSWKDESGEGVLGLPEDYADYQTLCEKLEAAADLREISAILETT